MLGPEQQLRRTDSEEIEHLEQADGGPAFGLPTSDRGRVILGIDLRWHQQDRWDRSSRPKARVFMSGRTKSVLHLNECWLPRSMLADLVRQINEVLYQLERADGVACCASERVLPFVILLLSFASITGTILSMVLGHDLQIMFGGISFVLLPLATSTWYCCVFKSSRDQKLSAHVVCERFAKDWSGKNQVQLTFRYHADDIAVFEALKPMGMPRPKTRPSFVQPRQSEGHGIQFVRQLSQISRSSHLSHASRSSCPSHAKSDSWAGVHSPSNAVYVV